jgi:hypothetical protein
MRQGSLFDILPPENPSEMVGVAGVMAEVCAEMNGVAESYGPGRKHLVDAVTAVAKRERVALTSGGGKELKAEVLDKWLQPSQRAHEPSIEAILCYCLATGSARPIKPILKRLKLVIIMEEELEDLEYGKLCMAERKLRERKKALEARR